MADVPNVEQTIFLSSQPAGRGARRLATAIIAVSSLIFLVLVPFAKVQLGTLPAFIPMYQSALFINDLLTAVFLLEQCLLSRSRALGLLAGGYLFTALMAVSHGLTFPGAFTPSGLLGAGPQTTVWLYMLWHGGFPLFILAYALNGPKEQSLRQSNVALLCVAAGVCALVCGFTFVATLGQDFLPVIMQGNRHMASFIFVSSVAWMINPLALIVLARRRPYSVLDLWLMVAVCAWLFDIALSSVLNGGRYDLGFYAGRIYGLLAASFVLVVLLFENGKLYAQLNSLRESDRKKAGELHRLSNVDTLTGVANRRAFDEALDQEWRRMLRHKTALSLLLIDVDFFKRFNDTYGHVAGDECLKGVAQALAKRARRAGEIAARYGGEEFAILLPHADVEEATKLAELMCEAVREHKIPHEASPVAPYVTISIGVASISQLPKSVAALCREGAAAGPTVLVETADGALYQAKVAGRNRVVTAGAGDFAVAAIKRLAASCAWPAA